MIRRIDTEGNARISIHELKEFLKIQVPQKASFIEDENPGK